MTGIAGNKYLLDTNIIIAYFNREESIRQHLHQNKITSFIPIITLGELYFGAYKSARTASNLKQIQNLISLITVIACDKITADQYGQIKEQIQSKGRPIPENDIWIAAIALQHDMILVTRDEHFQIVDNLSTEVW